jgi:site-specific recombinase XerD
MTPGETVPSNAVTRLDQGARSFERFDPKRLAPFCERSVSEETRRAYRRVVREFFHFFGNRHPAQITPADIIRWRDHLISSRKSASTITFKLSVVWSMFEYLKLGGYITTNPAHTKMVRPPALPEEMSGRALSPKEVRHLLVGPDRAKPVRGA